MSASGSGSKSKLTYWPSKDGQKKAANDYDPNVMEEYLKKQKQGGLPATTAVKKPVAPADKDHSESSDRYDEDFESISRS